MGDSRPGRAGARAHREDDRVGLLQRSQRRLLEPDLSGSERARSTGSDLAVPGDVRRLAGRQPHLPGSPDPGHGLVVLRLGGNAVPVVDPRHLRRRLRPRAAFVGGQHLRQAEGALWLTAADGGAIARGERPLRVERLRFRGRLSRCDSGDCNHLPGNPRGGDHPALAAQGHLQQLADREVQDRRNSDDHGGRRRGCHLHRFHDLRVGHQRDLRLQQRAVGHLPRGHVPPGCGHLRHRAGGTPAAGHRPLPHPPRDSG